MVKNRSETSDRVQHLNKMIVFVFLRTSVLLSKQSGNEETRLENFSKSIIAVVAAAQSRITVV